VVTVVTDDVLFAPGSATLEASGRRVLDVLAPTLTEFDNPIMIEGHTDDRPINTDRFPSNWELSSHRATTVLRELVDAHHLDPRRLSASGYGEQHPIGDNSTAEGRAANRRVELVIVSKVGVASDATPEPSGSSGNHG
jgi:chemotaxis protein MotB